LLDVREQGHERGAERREGVVDANRDRRGDRPADQPVALQRAQRLGEHLLADARDAAAQVRVPLRAVGQCREHERDPFVADPVQQPARRAGGEVGVVAARRLRAALLGRERGHPTAACDAHCRTRSSWSRFPRPSRGRGRSGSRWPARRGESRWTWPRRAARSWRSGSPPRGSGSGSAGTWPARLTRSARPASAKASVAEDLAVGTAVIGLSDLLGLPFKTQAEHVVLDASAVAPAPRGLDPVAASTIALNALTADQALDALALPAGSTLLVTGAAGAVGGYAVQLARHRGLEVVACAAAADEELVRELGAQGVVPRGADLPTAVRALVPGGVDGVVDAAPVGAAAHEALRNRGAFAHLAATPAPAPLRGA